MLSFADQHTVGWRDEMQKLKRQAPLVAMFGGLAVFSSGCSLGDISTILSILKALGII